MSILTKALVVLVTVLSIVVVALVVPFVATQENYREELTQVKTDLGLAQKSAASLQASLTQANQEESARNVELQNKVAQLEKDKLQLDSEKTAAVANEKAVREQVESLKQSYASLSGTMEEQKKMIALLTQQVQDSQAEVVDQGKKLLQMADRIDELTTERDGLVRQVRNSKEEATALTQELQDMRDLLGKLSQEQLAELTGAAGAGAAATANVPETPIAGQITAVEKVADDVWLVQINVGKSDRVSEGMEFLVHRGDEFKGKLVISRVEPGTAVGRMQLVQKDPVAGDAVYAGGY